MIEFLVAKALCRKRTCKDCVHFHKAAHLSPYKKEDPVTVVRDQKYGFCELMKGYFVPRFVNERICFSYQKRKESDHDDI